MIAYIAGDLLDSPAKVLVNTVNTRGVMGAGIALRFKKIYPDMFMRYRELCEQGRFRIGNLFLYKTSHKWILNFPTKDHWRAPSRTEFIEAGLRKFIATHDEMGITSIAFPLLGCGNGGLDYDTQVRPLMEHYLGNASFPSFIYHGMPKTLVPEHHDSQRVATWLRSEPSALPFDEVWQDILALLSQTCQFSTRKTRNVFTVTAQDNPASLFISSPRKRFHISNDELVDFWQQLRDYGITHRNIAPDHRNLSYLAPLFVQLPYVHMVEISETTTGLRANPAVGLQVLPPPLLDQSSSGELFEHNTHAVEVRF